MHLHLHRLWSLVFNLGDPWSPCVILVLLACGSWTWRKKKNMHHRNKEEVKRGQTCSWGGYVSDTKKYSIRKRNNTNLLLQRFDWLRIVNGHLSSAVAIVIHQSRGIKRELCLWLLCSFASIGIFGTCTKQYGMWGPPNWQLDRAERRMSTHCYSSLESHRLRLLL